LINTDLTSEVNFSLRDPWFIQGGSQPNNFRQITENSFEALLDQNEDYQTDCPIYEIKVPSSYQKNVHNKNVTYNFIEWSGTDIDFENNSNDQTKVVFQESGAIIQPVYKGNFASTSGTALSSAGSRKIAVKPGWNPVPPMVGQPFDPGIFLVYEDGGEIYFKHSNYYAGNPNNGVPQWEPYQRLSDGNGNCSYPSIAIQKGTFNLDSCVYIYVAYQQYNSATQQYDIKILDCNTLNITSWWAPPCTAVSSSALARPRLLPQLDILLLMPLPGIQAAVSAFLLAV
jgi:hypothetical protein